MRKLLVVTLVLSVAACTRARPPDYDGGVDSSLTDGLSLDRPLSDKAVSKPDAGPAPKSDKATPELDTGPTPKPDKATPQDQAIKPDSFIIPKSKVHTPAGACQSTVTTVSGLKYVEYCVVGTLGKIDNFLVGCQDPGCNLALPKVITKSTKTVSGVTYYCRKTCISKSCLKAKNPKQPLQTGYNMVAPVGGVVQDPQTKIYHVEHWEDLDTCQGKYCKVSNSRWIDGK